jgi:hypothetical protein
VYWYEDDVDALAAWLTTDSSQILEKTVRCSPGDAHVFRNIMAACFKTCGALDGVTGSSIWDEAVASATAHVWNHKHVHYVVFGEGAVHALSVQAGCTPCSAASRLLQFHDRLRFHIKQDLEKDVDAYTDAEDLLGDACFYSSRVEQLGSTPQKLAFLHAVLEGGGAPSESHDVYWQDVWERLGDSDIDFAPPPITDCVADGVASQLPDANVGDIELQSFRSTTSATDDWLHRGSDLWDMPKHIYIACVQRSRLPKAGATTDKIFLFDAHYALAPHYCQRVNVRKEIVPVYEGASCPIADLLHGEEHARYKSSIASLCRCSGPDHCADALNFSNCLFPLGHKQLGKRTFAMHWKARRAEIEVLADAADVKTRQAKKVACVADTTLCAQWFGSIEEEFHRPHQYFRLVLKSLFKQKNTWCGTWLGAQSDAYAFGAPQPSAETAVADWLGITLGVHPLQLTLPEFCAYRMRRVLCNVDCDVEARNHVPSKGLGRKEAAAAQEDDIQAEHLASDQVRTDHIGGQVEEDDEDGVESDEDAPARVHQQANFPDNELHDIFLRTAARQRLTKAGKHKEQDKVFKRFYENFKDRLEGAVNNTRMAAPVFAHRVCTRTSRQENAAQQRAVAKFHRLSKQDVRDQAGASTNHTPALAQALRNLDQDELRCLPVDADLAMQGPRAYAGFLMQNLVTKDGENICLNQEQKEAMALFVDCMEQGFAQRTDKSSHLMDKYKQFMTVIFVGGGGCGKSMLLTMIIEPLILVYFGPEGLIKQAPSNKAAKNIGGSTVHSSSGLTPDDELITSKLGLSSKSRKTLELRNTPAGGLAIDEFSMFPAKLMHADALRFMLSRARAYNLDPHTYAQPKHVFGNIPFLGIFGDHLQLPPVPPSASLLAPLVNKSKEHAIGAKIFREVNYVFEFHDMQRFKNDPLLRSILETMRTKGGARLTEEQRDALKSTEVGASQPSGEATTLQGTDGWYQVSYLWAEVSMAAYIHAKESAALARQKFYCVQACDHIASAHGIANPGTSEFYRAFLEEPNVNTTKRLPSFCYLHLGLRVRITLNFLPPLVTTDSTGVVVGFKGLDEDVFIQRRPPDVFIKVDGLEAELLAPSPCSDHERANRECLFCHFYPGIVQISPKQATWKYYPDPGQQKEYINVRRCQLPLFPMTALTLYQIQGSTADPGIVGHFGWQPREKKQIKWLIIYVLLSRPRSLKNLRSIGLDRPEVFQLIEEGPPPEVIGEFDDIFTEKIRITHEAARAALRKCQW